MTKDEVKTVLQNYYVQAKFIKADGSTRIMLCTLMSEVLPEIKNKDMKLSDEVQRVWNVDLQEWRSFRWDSLIALTWQDGTNEVNWTKDIS